MNVRQPQSRVVAREHSTLALGSSLLGVSTIILLVGRNADSLGVNLPVLDREADYLIGVAWATLLGLLLAVLPIDRRYKNDLIVLWVARCGITLGAMLFYEARYDGLDAYAYFGLGRDYQFRPWAIGGLSSTERMLALVSLISAVMPESFHAVKITFSFIGLLGTYYAARAAIVVLEERISSRAVLYCIGLFPSLVFWSSTIGKDPIALLGIGLYAFSVVSWCRSRRRRFAVGVLLGLAICAAVRPWLGPILVGPLVFLPPRRRRPPSFAARGAVVAITWGACLGLLWALGASSPADITDIIASQAEGWQGGGGGSTQMVAVDFRDMRSLATFIPYGMMTALFRPLPGEVPHAFGLLAGAESVVLLALLGRALAKARIAELGRGMTLWLLAVVVAWSAIYSLISAFNLGAAVRFRIQVLPFLLPLLLILGAPMRSRWAMASRVASDVGDGACAGVSEDDAGTRGGAPASGHPVLSTAP